MQLGLLTSTDLRTWCGCRACLWMLLSSIVRRGVWQSLACLRWHWATCSMTSPYRQEVCRHSFQSFSILDQYLAIHVEHYVYAAAAGARYHLKYSLSDHKELSSRGLSSTSVGLSFHRKYWLRSLGIFRWLMRRSSRWESLPLLVFRGSP